jgi:hypothetical protein
MFITAFEEAVARFQAEMDSEVRRASIREIRCATDRLIRHDSANMIYRSHNCFMLFSVSQHGDVRRAGTHGGQLTLLSQRTKGFRTLKLHWRVTNSEAGASDRCHRVGAELSGDNWIT